MPLLECGILELSMFCSGCLSCSLGLPYLAEARILYTRLIKSRYQPLSLCLSDTDRDIHMPLFLNFLCGGLG